MVPLPAYINPEAWAGFVEMRKSMPKTRPFTPRAAALILYELQRIKDAGHDPNAALDQSTLHGWTDVYAPKEKAIERAPQSAADSTRAVIEAQRLTAEERAASEAARQRVMAAVRPGIRRVA